MDILNERTERVRVEDCRPSARTVAAFRERELQVASARAEIATWPIAQVHTAIAGYLDDQRNEDGSLPAGCPTFEELTYDQMLDILADRAGDDVWLELVPNGEPDPTEIGSGAGNNERVWRPADRQS